MAKTFKQLVYELSEVRSKEDLNKLETEIYMSFTTGKITGKDNDALYNIINYVVKREYIG